MNVLELAQVAGKPVKSVMSTLIDAGSDVENAMSPVGDKYFKLFGYTSTSAIKALIEIKDKVEENSVIRAKEVSDAAPSVEDIALLPQCRIMPDNFKCSKENPECLESNADGKNCAFAV